MSKQKTEDKVKERKEKKKKEKRSDKDGVHKVKKDKKDKSSKHDKKSSKRAEGIEQELDERSERVAERKQASPKDRIARLEAMLQTVQETALVPFALPLATMEESLLVLKGIIAATENQTIKRGIKEVSKQIKKKGGGIVVIGGDISPLDVISHFPSFCEANGCPYIFLRSRHTLGEASNTNRSTSVVMIHKERKTKVSKDNDTSVKPSAEDKGTQNRQYEIVDVANEEEYLKIYAEIEKMIEARTEATINSGYTQI